MSVALTREQLAALSRPEREELLLLLQEQDRRQAQRLFFALYGDANQAWAGPQILKGLVQPGQTLHARHLYPKHTEFFAAGKTHRERCFMAANRVGKTFGGGGYETACHLTGLYPDWWEGRRFDTPVSAWAAGKTNETTRDILQLTMLGEVAYEGQRKVMDGRGVIPGHLLGIPKWKQGVPDLVDTIKVKHVSGQSSVLGFKSYDQGRGAFEGTGQHVIWADEEPPMDVYGEMLIRTATTGGIVLMTFTPLEGLSQVVMSFLPKEMRLSDR
jgi:phage terminase large subunit-like protein